jgi:hypothetical protein
MILEATLSTNFVPSTNLKGRVAGANWTFLLPGLDLERAVCIGTPAVTTLTTLSQLSRDINVACDADRIHWFERTIQNADLNNVSPVIINHHFDLPLPSKSTDLILIVGRKIIRRLHQNQEGLLELQRLLKPEGLIYFEFEGIIDQLFNHRVLKKLIQKLGNPYSLKLWLTPLSGEFHTAVPLSDQKTMNYFVQHELYSPSLTAQSGLVKGVAALLGKSRRFNQSVRLGPNPGEPARRSRVSEARQILRLWAQRLGIGIISVLGRIEAALSRSSLFGGLIRRNGIMVGSAAADLALQPPRYLLSIAREAGINLKNYRWGLSADGNYSSRKLVFFLFDSATDSKNNGSISSINLPPKYVVKMVRESIFNRRLENEHQALLLLQEKRIGDGDTFPQVAFFGYHAGLAILGESVIEGVPFRQRMEASPDCPYARSVINWLTELGAITADSTIATSWQAAASLETLFNRFTEIYKLDSDHYAFLAGQIASIGQSPAAFPSVFQHGDPGTWNIMVTNAGRVAFLDWEAAEPQGMPLWDLLYFLRSYTIGASRTRGGPDGLKAFAQQFLAASPFSSMIMDATQHYCEQIRLPGNLIEPLFYTCWMHRALKEATRLSPAKLEKGGYVNLLRLCIERHDSPTLKWLFSLN